MAADYPGQGKADHPRDQLRWPELGVHQRRARPLQGSEGWVVGGESIRPTKVKKAEVAIKGLLAEHGRQFSTIRTEIRQIPPAAVGITFVIKEGPEGQGGQDQVRGQQERQDASSALCHEEPAAHRHSALDLSGKHLRPNLRRHQAGRRYRTRPQRISESRLFQGDRRTSPRPRFTTPDTRGRTFRCCRAGPGKSVDITMPIEEGDRYTLGWITFKNNKARR